jgi:hypothetical protein
VTCWLGGFVPKTKEAAHGDTKGTKKNSILGIFMHIDKISSKAFTF